MSNHTTEQLPPDVVSDIRIKEQMNVVSSADEIAKQDYTPKMEVTSGTQPAYSRIGPGINI
jgi:hypothetical protein